ncbi:hypothetical protein [Mucilaginibacter lacusdianchii]|uniref:hypothetical protein n=1 Tax=Mucilaginibacter lacusdianchii TaxID=2684211 RepID=UPI00131D3382|nr:hypothetical protein [Mucilaginibacter sp. JXJ CY 39]
MNKLVKYILVIACVCTGFKGFSQFRQPPAFRDSHTGPALRIDAVKENYIKDKLDLTDDEASRFWPVYRQYHNEMVDVRRQKRLNMSNPNGSDQVRKEMYYDEKLVEIKRRYTDEFLKILPPQKVSQIFKSENEFTKELIRQLGERRGRPE